MFPHLLAKRGILGAFVICQHPVGHVPRGEIGREQQLRQHDLTDRTDVGAIAGTPRTIASMIETGTPSLELVFRNRSTELSAYSFSKSGLLMCPSISWVRLGTPFSFAATKAWSSSRSGPSPACRQTTLTSGSASATRRTASIMMWSCLNLLRVLTDINSRVPGSAGTHIGPSRTPSRHTLTCPGPRP